MSAIKLKNKVWISKEARKKLQPLKRVFKKLAVVHQAYIDAESGSCPYWYSERPHVGLLAAAVWQSGGVALEEYGTTKGKRRNTYRGRCDLWVKIRKTSFECEAKRLWLRLGRGQAKKHLSEIEAAVKRAVTDVANSKKGLALCFVTPAIRKESFSELKNGCRDLFQLLKTKVKKDGARRGALVWIGFPEEHKNINGDFHYPGLLLVVREV